MRKALLFLPLAVFIVLAVVLWRGLSLDPRELPSALLDKPFPAFTLGSLHDGKVLLTEKSLPKQPMLINVWATWCPACRQEHPYLMRLARETDTPLIGLNYKDDRDAALTWLKQLGNPYRFTIFDGEGMLGLDLGVYGAPETYLVDGKGVIRHRHVGVVTPEVWAELKRKINQLN